MSAPAVRPTPRTRPTAGLVVMLLANVVLGAPAYFVAFLFAYGFRDTVGPVEHTAFLVMVGGFAAVTGLVGALVDAAAGVWRRTANALAVVVTASLSLNCLVVAVGSVVSAMHKDQGSVSAAFSPLTDVLVAGGLLLAAALLAAVSLRAARSSRRP